MFGLLIPRAGVGNCFLIENGTKKIFKATFDFMLHKQLSEKQVFFWKSQVDTLILYIYINVLLFKINISNLNEQDKLKYM